jgi:hypothetical protein
MGVTISDPVNPDDPFSSSVTITNTGYLPLKFVVPKFCVKEIDYGPPVNPVVLRTESGACDMVFKNSQTPLRLGLDGQSTFLLNQLFEGPKDLDRASIGIIVDYRIPIIHVQMEKNFPFVAERQTLSANQRQMNGKFFWHAQAPAD